MLYTVRPFTPAEYPLLNDFLYEAIFVPEGAEKPPRDVINAPELQVYTENFGRPGDFSIAAEVNGKIIGAAWARIMNDYGHIDDNTPSLAVSLYDEYRGHGIGIALLKALFTAIREAGYTHASLSVQKENRAAKLYEKLGFRTVRETDEEFIMICELGHASL